MFFLIFPTNLGEMALVWKGKQSEFLLQKVYLPRTPEKLRKLLLSDFPNAEPSKDRQAVRMSRKIKNAVEGKPADLTGIPVDLSAVSDFSKKVYTLQRKIPAGKVLSYGELAKRAGKPKASRVVGSFQAKNPFPVVIPCHRIVRSDRSVGPFQTGSLMKRQLLEREGVKILNRNNQFFVAHGK